MVDSSARAFMPPQSSTEACPACGSVNTRLRTRIREFDFRRCLACRTLFCADPSATGDSSQLYQHSAYFENPNFGSPQTGGYHGYKDYIADRRQIEQKFTEILRRLEQLCVPGRLVDVGAGPGFLIATARQRGWKACGVDLNPWAAEYARNELGLDVRPIALTDAALAEGSFDAVTMMDLLEHVVNPAEVVAEAARITRSGGALVVLTPDAGSPISRLLGNRWPEVQRAPEHLTLFSVRGLAGLLERHGYVVAGWHSVGKASELGTLLADAYPLAPRVIGRLQARLASDLARRVIKVDPHTKFCIYAVRTGTADGDEAVTPDLSSRGQRFTLRGRFAEAQRPDAEEAIFEDLATLARANGLCDWMFEQYETAVRGRVAEVGAGIGTFSQRILARRPERLLLVEPEPRYAQRLRARFSDESSVEVVEETLPDAPSLGAAEGFDLVVCQNVLEHIADDQAATRAMANSLRMGGQLSLLVPAHPCLYGELDRTYEHHRRYTAGALRGLIEGARLELLDLYSFNLLGVPGWWLNQRRPAAQIDHRALMAYEAALRVWRPLERLRRPPWGLSLVAHARKRTITNNG